MSKAWIGAGVAVLLMAAPAAAQPWREGPGLADLRGLEEAAAPEKDAYRAALQEAEARRQAALTDFTTAEHDYRARVLQAQDDFARARWEARERGRATAGVGQARRSAQTAEALADFQRERSAYFRALKAIDRDLAAARQDFTRAAARAQRQFARRWS